jgi:hypothetical protein
MLCPCCLSWWRSKIKTFDTMLRYDTMLPSSRVWYSKQTILLIYIPFHLLALLCYFNSSIHGDRLAGKPLHLTLIPLKKYVRFTRFHITCYSQERNCSVNRSIVGFHVYNTVWRRQKKVRIWDLWSSGDPVCLSADWLTDWPDWPDWLAGWLTDWLTDWLTPLFTVPL